MKRNSTRRKVWRYFGAGLFWMAAASGVHGLVERTWLVNRLETANLDALSSVKQAKVSPDVVVVSITDEDYQTVFGGIGPLNSGKLRPAIDAILADGPKALAVDLDSSAWSGLPTRYAGKPIVWAREAPAQSVSFTTGNAPGGREPVCFGVPAYFPDYDGMVRAHREFTEGPDHRYYPSLAFNLVEVSERGAQACSGASTNLARDQSTGAEKVNIRGTKNAFEHLSLAALLTLKSPPLSAVHPLHNKIVLLGAAYRAARDAYPTPFGYLDGVDLVASTVDRNLAGNKELSDMPRWLVIAGYVEGVLLLAGLYFVSRNWSLLAGILAGPVIVLLVSWLTYRWAGAFVSFVPCFAGILIHEAIQHANEYRRLQEENRELEDHITYLRSGAAIPPKRSKREGNGRRT